MEDSIIKVLLDYKNSEIGLIPAKDRILSLLGENEIVVLDAPDVQHVGLLDVRKSECEADSSKAIEQTSGAALENRIDLENLCVCMKPKFYEYKPNNTIICVKCTKLHITHINEEIIAKHSVF